MNECYKCKYKGNVAGSCHSSCTHPDIKEDEKVMHMFVIMGIGASAVGTKPNDWIIVGDPHGVKSGWFNWPIDFDPVWIKRCDGQCE